MHYRPTTSLGRLHLSFEITLTLRHELNPTECSVITVFNSKVIQRCLRGKSLISGADLIMNQVCCCRFFSQRYIDSLSCCLEQAPLTHTSGVKLKSLTVKVIRRRIKTIKEKRQLYSKLIEEGEKEENEKRRVCFLSLPNRICSSRLTNIIRERRRKAKRRRG